MKPALDEYDDERNRPDLRPATVVLYDKMSEDGLREEQWDDVDVNVSGTVEMRNENGGYDVLSPLAFHRIKFHSREPTKPRSLEEVSPTP